jgi:LEA14-like dessication related protein
MIKKSRKIIIVIGIILAISGFLGYTYYADATTLNNAEVTIENIHLQELSLTYCKLKIYIDISNPTNRDISGLTAVFNIYIADNYVGSGSFSKVSIPAQSNREKDVTITIYYAKVAVAVVDGIKRGNFDLTIKGEASGDVLFDLITVSKQFKATKVYP